MRLAAIDLGSNSFRLEIGKVDNDTILSEGSWKETVRLAAGIDSKGYLTEAAQQRALQALSRIAEKLEGFPRTQVRAVGTQTLRAAVNSQEFIDKAEAILKCPIEIIRGREEARLVFEGCSFALPVSTKRRLIVDIGGASTECVIGQNRQVLEADSFHVGCVNTSVAFFKNGEVTRSQMHKAQLAAEAEFDSSVRKFLNSGWDEAYGSSGTVGAISQILHESGMSDGTLTWDLLQTLKEQMLEFGTCGKFKFAGMKDDRREVLAGGIAVLLAIFNKFEIKSMRPAGGALRYGLLHDLAGRKLEQDPRAASVNSLVDRLNGDKEQATRVADIAEQLFKGLMPEATSDQVKELRWASTMHEIGLSLSRSDYHRHSEYLIRNSDIPGFSKPEQERLAAIVLGHRGNLKKVDFLLNKAVTAAQVFSLRMAVIFAHARRDITLPPIQQVAGPKSFTMSLPATWLREHPLTEFMINQEKEIWQRVGYRFDFFER